MVGLTVTKQTIDSAAGSVAVAVEVALTKARQLKYFMDGQVDADLVALGYTAGEVATLRSAAADLDTLAAVYQGASTQGSVKDFRTFARRLTGVSTF